MQILENISLADHSTMRLGGAARYLVEVTSEGELVEALEFAAEKGLKVHVAGSGSNTIFSDAGFDGLVILNRIPGLTEESRDDSLELVVGAGENWDAIVARSVELGFSDIAALSMIPGTVGAAPVQNIGAYGQQISDCIISVRTYDAQMSEFNEILKKDCDFSYRHSRFNTAEKNRFIITSVRMRLHRKTVEAPFYADIERYFTENTISTNNVSPEELRGAVIHIRSIKLPDPKDIASCGSFFKNPVVSQDIFNTLIQQYPNLKSHRTDDGQSKLYAGQLMEMCGLKDFHDQRTGMATWKNQALVVVNESAKTTEDLLAFKRHIINAVHQKFNITLEQEPEFIA